MPISRGLTKLLDSFVAVSVVAVATSCDVSPGAAKRKYLQKANQFFSVRNFSEAALNYRKAIQKDQGFGEAYYGLAQSELQLNKPREAYESMSRAVALLPGREDVKVKLADVSLLLYLSDSKHPTNLYDQLTKFSDEMLAKDPNSFDGLRVKGYLAMSEKNTANAVEFFRKANTMKPMQPEVGLALAQGLIKLNRYAEAEKAALELIRSNKSFGPIYDVLSSLYLVTSRSADAEKILRAKADNNPKIAAYITQLAAYYARAGNTAQMNVALQRLLSHPTDFPQAHLFLGDFYAGLGKLQEARQQLEQGARANPKDASVYQKRIVNLLLLQGRKSEAEKLVDTMLEADSKDRGSQMMRATMLLDSGKAEKIDAAVTEFKELVTKSPADTVAHYNLGRAFLAQGDLDSARGQFLESIKQKRDYLAPRFHLTDIAIQTRQYNDAIRYAGEILAFQPNNARARLLRARAQAGSEKYREAREGLAKLMKERQFLVDVQLELGFIATSERRFTEADGIFRKLYKPGDTDLRPLEGLVESLAAQREFDKALLLLREELKRSPDSVAIRYYFATTAARGGKFDVAGDQFEHLTSKYPTIADFEVHLGEVFYQKGDLNRAVASLQKAQALAPKSPRVATYLASLLEAAGKNDAAVAAYRQSLQLEPNNPVALNNLANLLANSKKSLEEAARLAEKAQKQMPDSPVIADTMAWIYLQRGLLQSASHIFQNLSRKYPTNPTYRYHYGLSLWKSGDKKKANDEFAIALLNGLSKVEESRIKELVAGAK